MDGLSWWQGRGEKIWMAKIDDRENRRQSERWLIRYGWVCLMTGKSWGKGRRPSPSGGDQPSPRRTLRWPTMNIFPYSTRRSRQWWWWSLPDWQAEGPFLFCASGVLGANPARQVTDRTRDLLLGFGRCPFSDFIHTMFWIYQIRHATIIPLLLYQRWFWSSLHLIRNRLPNEKAISTDNFYDVKLFQVQCPEERLPFCSSDVCIGLCIPKNLKTDLQNLAYVSKLGEVWYQCG